MLVRVSSVMSLSRYSDRYSVAISRSPWLSWATQLPYQPCGARGWVYLEDEGMIVLLQIKGKAIGVHENLPTSAQNINCSLDKLSFNP